MEKYEKELRELAEDAFCSIVYDMYRYCVKCYINENSKSLPFVSVEDDLPCKHEELICKDESRGYITEAVLVITSDNALSYAYMCLDKTNGKWRWACNENNIKQWLIIPEGIEEFLYGTQTSEKDNAMAQGRR